MTTRILNPAPECKDGFVARMGKVRVLRGPGALVASLAACAMAVAVAGCSHPGGGLAEKPDSAGTVWLCRPGLAHDPCTAPLQTTVVDGNGSEHVVNDEPASNPPIDCFYVYPNITLQQTDNANLDVDPQETAIAELEASPFSRACRVYAAIYREATGDGGGTRSSQIATESVASAWRDYLAHYNHGRGVVLVGHSEGSYQLAVLIIDQIEHNPGVRPLLVSAILTGGNLPVRTDGRLFFKDQHIQPCRSDTQTGCLIAYDSFSAPPPSDSMFGRQSPAAVRSGVETLCTNPASLSGGSGTLESLYRTHLPTQDVAGSTTDGIFVHPPTSTTPWIEFDGPYSARCVHSNGASVLMVTGEHHAPALTAAPDAAWGLHVDDPNIALGNLVAIVQAEAGAYTASHPR
jgi:hypothetical protein